ncbi:MAG: 4Fe-4S dicluster domain-containing protein, partial [Slackia sp.]|nr:4Fe-4S dicluster domain-containing protein [Slackia sp.]
METTTLGAIAAAGVAAGGIAVCFAGNGEELLRPPGASDEADFRARCIKCGRCLEACPYQAIRMAKGPTGAETGTPVIDARAQACRLCADFPCIAACPTEALHPVSARDEVRMGCAVINRDLCIAVQGMRCEVCYRACPFIDSAITIGASVREDDAIHAVFEPLVDPEKCVGCG